MVKATALEQLASDPDMFQPQSLNMQIFSVALSGLAVAGHFYAGRSVLFSPGGRTDLSD